MGSVESQHVEPRTRYHHRVVLKRRTARWTLILPAASLFSPWHGGLVQYDAGGDRAAAVRRPGHQVRRLRGEDGGEISGLHRHEGHLVLPETRGESGGGGYLFI